MRISLVVEWLETFRGGAETSTSQFIDELLRRNVSLEIFTRSTVPAKPGMSIHTIRPVSVGRARRTRSFMIAAAYGIRQAGCDLTHALIPCVGAEIYQPRGGLVAETIIRTIASRPPGLARILKRLDLATNARQRMLLNKERLWLGGEDKPIVVAISDYVVRQLREHYDYPESLLRHIFNGVSVERTDPETRAKHRREVRSSYGIEEDSLLLLQVCHNFHLKGVRCLIEALARVGHSCRVPIRALVVGGPQDATRGLVPRHWLALAKRLGVDGRVRFTGRVERVAALFHAADVLVHPTYYDPCSRVVLEGLSYGLPIISTRFDGASEVIEEAVTGFVLQSPRSIDELAQRLRLLADPETRKRMSAAALRRADDVTMAKHAEALCRLYRSLL